MSPRQGGVAPLRLTMALQQKLKKLRRMSYAEIGVRLREKFWTQCERWQYGRLAARPATGDRLPRFHQLAVPWLPGARLAQVRELASAVPALHAELVATLDERCSDLLSGHWRSLGHEFDFTGSVDWHQDPRSGYRFPRCFYAQVPLYGLPEGGDAKLAWEPGRHQFLFELAAGWAVSGDERRAALAARLWLDWIDQNPCCIGIHWTSALEVAMRIVVWQWTLALLADWSGWGPHDLGRISQSVVEHARFLSHHLSHYSSPYNHLIGEATGLYLAGCWLENGAGRGFRQQGAEVLGEHSRRQFCADAHTVEQASGYHFYTLGFLTLAREASRFHGQELAAIDPLLSHAWRTAALLQQPDGEWGRFGDIDSARTFPVLPRREWDFRGLLSLGAVCADDPLIARAAQRPGAELFWVRGLPGVRQFQDLTRAAPDSVPPALLPDAGYAVIRSTQAPGDWVLFDCGPIAAGLFADDTPSTAHGHADVLQLLVHHAGQPVLVDSGMDGYAGAASRVEWFRGPGAHNTLEVADAPIARHAGRLAWSHARHGERLQGVLGESLALTQGACVPTAGVRVERHLCVLPGTGIWIADRLQLSATRSIRWFWQPHTQGHPGRLSQGPEGCEFTWGEHALRMRGAGTDWQAREEIAKPDSPVGWKCTGYGQAEPGTSLQVQCTAPTGASTWLTSLIWGSAQVHVRFPGEPPPTGWHSPEIPATWPHAAQWQVETHDQSWQIVTGSGPIPPGTGWERVTGVGDWPCWRRPITSGRG